MRREQNFPRKIEQSNYLIRPSEPHNPRSVAALNPFNPNGRVVENKPVKLQKDADSSLDKKSELGRGNLTGENCENSLPLNGKGRESRGRVWPPDKT
jgi:hypothetical protein